MMKIPELIVCDVSRELFARLRQSGGGRFAACATTARDLPEQLRLSESAGSRPVVLWDLSSCTTEQVVVAVERGGDALLRVALLVVLPLGSVKARQIIKLLHYLPQAEVLLDGYDDPLRGVIRAMDALPERQATQCMIGPLVASVSTTVSDIVAAAILGGHRRITVSVLAQICALPIRTLEWRLRACGAPEARRMLGWVLSLHVLWRLDMLRRTPKQVAAASGFRSAEAMSAFVGRQTGCRPRAVMASGGFERLLDACVQRWQHGDLTQRARAL